MLDDVAGGCAGVKMAPLVDIILSVWEWNIGDQTYSLFGEDVGLQEGELPPSIL